MAVGLALRPSVLTPPSLSAKPKLNRANTRPTCRTPPRVLHIQNVLCAKNAGPSREIGDWNSGHPVDYG